MQPVQADHLFQASWRDRRLSSWMRARHTRVRALAGRAASAHVIPFLIIASQPLITGRNDTMAVRRDEAGGGEALLAKAEGTRQQEASNGFTGTGELFSASVGAGAALIGLIFVAVSIAPEKMVMVGAPLERQAVAASAYTALLNAFFISLFALIPGTSAGWVALVMSCSGLWSTVFLGRSLLNHPAGWRSTVRRLIMILAGIILYGLELYVAKILINTPSNASASFTLATLVGTAYGLGLLRAWQLIGARRFNLSSWLNPLRDVDDQQGNADREISRTAGKSATD